MKYIRTKDTEFRNGEIFEVLQENKEYYECGGTFEKRMHCKAYVKKEIVIKTADTIEELCDRFVIIKKDDNSFAIAKYYPSDKTFYIENYDEDVSLSECLMFEYEIYGAIWTEWGLKYVAKMNEKGELELI